MPEKEMTQHASYHVVVPPWKLSDLIVIHPKVRLGFFKTLLDSPAQSA
jgi:hypothetical protein